MRDNAHGVCSDVSIMAHAQPDLAAMMIAADAEWRANAPEDWTTINFWHWPRGFHRSAWVVAGYIGWNPLDVLDKPTPAARAVNALLTRLCVPFTIVMTRHTPDPHDPVELPLAWFNAAMNEHKHDIAEMIEGLGDAYWGVVQIRGTPITRNPLTIKALSISDVTWKWHFLNHAARPTR